MNSLKKLGNKNFWKTSVHLPNLALIDQTLNQTMRNVIDDCYYDWIVLTVTLVNLAQVQNPTKNKNFKV